MKNITIAGNIGKKDAETRTTQGGDKVTGFSVGVSEGFGDKKRTLWFGCDMWGARGEKLAPYLTSGSKITVSGDLSTREHDGKTYLTIRVADVTLQGGGERQERGGYDQSPARADTSRRAPAGGHDMDDEIPFICEWR